MLKISLSSLCGIFLELFINKIHLSNLTLEFISFPVLKRTKPRSGIEELFSLNNGIVLLIKSTDIELFIFAMARSVDRDNEIPKL